MPAKLHLLIAGATVAEIPALQAQPVPPNLRALLATLAPSGRIECAEDSPATPYELALAQAHGLPGAPGRIPWAAFETGTVGQPCAWIHPCHWRIGADHIQLDPTEDLALDEATSRALLTAMAPYFLQDGITLRYRDGRPGSWLAFGEPFRDLGTISMRRVAGQRLTPSFFNSSGGSAPVLRRLQNEMQMLLYTHASTEQRQREGLAPINSFWVTGAGELERPHPPAADVQVDERLRAATLQRDPAAHAGAWLELDAERCAALATALRAGDEVRLTLCGEDAAQSWGPARSGAWQRFSALAGLRTPTLDKFAL